MTDEPVFRIHVLDWAWVPVPLAVLVYAVVAGPFWFLNFVHVLFGVLWTGTDIFMGFIVGPILGRLDIATRKQFVTKLAPKMLFYMPTLSTVTLTAGYYLAERMGLVALGFAGNPWAVASGVLGLALFASGVGLLLPTNLRILFALRKPQPDVAKIQRLVRLYLVLVALQGAMQVATVVVMARLSTGTY